MEYLKLRAINGISKNWKRDINSILTKYLTYVDWNIDKTRTISYIATIQKQYSICAFRKQCYQIRRFLNYLNIEWADNIQPPKEPEHRPTRITTDNIGETIEFLKGGNRQLQLQALIHLGIDSGMRAKELYQLHPEDIDLANRIIYINHNPGKGQTTKTGKSWISFFTEQIQRVLSDYLTYFNSGCLDKKLFAKRTIQKEFKTAPIRVKQLRKYFSQEWDRQSGPTSIKKLLMGHSTRGNVDLSHYNAQSEEDL